MITFRKVQYKNFLSSGNSWTELQLDSHKTTLISGRNGSGKSTVLDAITFALYGKAFRNITKPSLVNSINAGGTEVVLEFASGKNEYKIIRGIKPNKFEIYKDGTLIDQEAATRDYQELLETQILSGMNEKVFKQVVVIGSADYKPFMHLSASVRREVIEELLDIKIFSHMSDVLKGRLSLIKEQLKESEYNISILEEKIKIHEQQEKKSNEAFEEKSKELQEKIESTEEKIKNIDAVILKYSGIKEELEKKYKTFSGVKTDLEKVRKELNTYEIALKNSTKTKEFFSHNESCPTCQQKIDKDHKCKIISERDQENQEIEKNIATEKFLLTALESRVKTMEDIYEGIRKIEMDIHKFQSKKSSEQGLIDAFKNELKKTKEVKKQETSEVDVVKKSLDTQKANRSSLMEQREYHEICLGMTKDGGIKTKIIKQYIPVMNTLINDYLTRFGLPIEFTLDEEFNEVIKSRYRDGFSYNNFSEGEKHRIDLSILLCWRSIAKGKNTTNCNLLIMDETFDSSLDASATEELLNILRNMDKDTNIFIISHKGDLTDKLSNHIEFHKVGNFSRIK